MKKNRSRKCWVRRRSSSSRRKNSFQRSNQQKYYRRGTKKKVSIVQTKRKNNQITKWVVVIVSVAYSVEILIREIAIRICSSDQCNKVELSNIL